MGTKAWKYHCQMCREINYTCIIESNWFIIIITEAKGYYFYPILTETACMVTY